MLPLGAIFPVPCQNDKNEEKDGEMMGERDGGMMGEMWDGGEMVRELMGIVLYIFRQANRVDLPQEFTSSDLRQCRRLDELW